MKIAFCLYGIVGGRQGKDGLGGDIEFVKCYDQYKACIFDHNDVDVFFHTWSTQHEKPIRRIYNPKKYIAEPQIQFDVAKGEEKHRESRFRSCSRWYSTMKSLQLQQQYATENNINYDFIMITRFDVIWWTKIPFETMDKNSFYVANWNLHKTSGLKGNSSYPFGHMKRYSDMWFIGNQEQMNHLAGTYNVMRTLGNHEYDPHYLVFERMYPAYGENVKFMFYNSIDFALYRKYLKRDYS